MCMLGRFYSSFRRERERERGFYYIVLYFFKWILTFFLSFFLSFKEVDFILINEHFFLERLIIF